MTMTKSSKANRRHHCGQKGIDLLRQLFVKEGAYVFITASPEELDDAVKQSARRFWEFRETLPMADLDRLYETVL